MGIRMTTSPASLIVRFGIPVRVRAGNPSGVPGQGARRSGRDRNRDAGHRSRRKKRTLKSALDDIPGIGPAKRKALLKALGSVSSLKQASVEELAKVSGVGPKIAERIHAALHPATPGGQKLTEARNATDQAAQRLRGHLQRLCC